MHDRSDVFDLVVHDGDHVTATGTLVRDGDDHWCLVAHEGHVAWSADGELLASQAVPVYAPTSVDLTTYCHAESRFHGVWLDGALLIEGRAGASEKRVAVPRSRTPAVPHPPQLRPANERALFEDGTLLDLWPEISQDGTVTTIALVAPRASRAHLVAALSTRDGNLKVVESCWPRRTLDAITDVLCEEDSPVLSWGTAVTSQRQLVVSATVSHMTRALASKLHVFPTEAMEIRALLHPQTA